jgi:transposase
VFPLGRLVLSVDDRAQGGWQCQIKITTMKSLPVLNPKAAAIDVGSERLHVSVAGEEPEVFGTFTAQLEALRDRLRQQGVNTVAMEATGVYWLYLYEVLEAAGLEVVVNGRHVQNVPGRKTDMADCQWLATLHAHGLLRGGFVPPADIRRLQDYQRLRNDHIIGAAAQVQKMQQALERMNVKLHDVISDLTGVSGLRVVRAILRGERRPGELLALCDEQIQKKKSLAVKESLRGCWKQEQLFALRQAMELWDTYQQKIADCNRELEALLRELAGPTPPAEGEGGPPLKLAPAKFPGKNAPDIEGFQELMARVCGGRDLTQIPGLSANLTLQLVSEVGKNMACWPTEKHFVSWLGLAGGRKQSGKRKGSIKAHRNRAGRIFCAAARALGQSVDKALGGFYRRLRGRIGGLAANVALARKLAQLFYRLLRYGIDYVEKGLKAYEIKVLETEARLLRKLAKKQGFILIPAARN